MASSSKPDLLSPPLKRPHDSVTTTTTTNNNNNNNSNRKRKLETSNSTNNINNHLLKPSSMETDIDLALSSSSHLTHQELLRRRLHRLHQLSKVYRDHYWAFMEDLRVHYRHYYWKFGVSPSKDDDDKERESGADRDFAATNVEGCGETNNTNNNSLTTCVASGGNNAKSGLGFGDNGSEVKLGGNNPCAFVVCKLKAMALTNFCYLHILSDPQQQLYKACNYIIKIAQQGPILCGRPILKSTVPSLCHIHFPKAQKDVKHALKKAGLNVSSSSKLAPKFHVLVAKYVQQIQTKRKAAEKHNKKSVVIKEESMS
ncbi:INO80 complex subunit D [Bienertia sinuspersici]